MHQELAQLLAPERLNTMMFQDVMSVLRRHYEFVPVAFTTGAGTAKETRNRAGSNAASCLLLAAARRLGFSMPETLALYREHYRDVLADPEGNAHGNIRALMVNGWDGVVFGGDPLRLKGPG
jgi:hypothetical protein